jgi:diaminohydroxyphosphoribosylaminopyrimidine deaminase/5-amino-6-(5-phosphoribosylamino)uracil reductase
MKPTASDKRWMRLALSLGERGLGQTWPNPSVGCIIVKDETELGRGWTQTGGRPHGEVVALEQAGDATGSTVYVTLEPCAHTGKTPPCSQALIDAKVSRVVIATTDPDPRVAGKGIQMLKDAGITVTLDVLKSEADQAHAGFFSRIQNNRPFVTLKLATSLDGRIATKTGDSQWITSEESRQHVHHLRSIHDAVMVGRGTVDADNPTLNVRGLDTQIQQPVRLIMDSTVGTDPNGNLGQTAQDTPVWLCHNTDADFSPWQNTGAKSVTCKSKDGRIDLNDAMRQLANKGLTRVFCEGGGTLAAGLIKAGLVDQLILMQAGVAIGSDGTASLGSMGINTLSEAPRFELQDTKKIGPDTISVWHKSA